MPRPLEVSRSLVTEVIDNRSVNDSSLLEPGKRGRIDASPYRRETRGLGGRYAAERDGDPRLLPLSRVESRVTVVERRTPCPGLL